MAAWRGRAALSLALALALLTYVSSSRRSETPHNKPRYALAHWMPANRGNHRALLHLRDAGGADVARAHLTWRLPGLPMQQRQLVLHAADPETREELGRVRNVLVLSISSEAAEIVFEPRAGHSTYLLYYLPYDARRCETGPAASCPMPYLNRRETANGEWRRRALAVTRKEGWRLRAPVASVIAYEARTARDSFFPMEVAATADEASALAKLRRPLLVWPEDRLYPVRMHHTLPQRWVDSGVTSPNATCFRSEARRGEFFTFQVGAHSPLGQMDVRAGWTGLQGVATQKAVPVSRIRCINFASSRVDTSASPGGFFTPTLSIPAGGVGALWFGVDLPDDLPADTYVGTILVGSGLVVENVALQLRVADVAPLVAKGDNELWRHSRLRWLDSDVGTVPDAGDGKARWDPARSAVSSSGNRLAHLNSVGLHASLRVNGRELLARESALQLKLQGGELLEWSAASPVVATETKEGTVRWTGGGATANVATCGRLRVSIRGEAMDDGLHQLTAELAMPTDARAQECKLDDVALLLPLLSSATPLINGFGVKGAERPDSVEWKWDDDVEHGQRGLNCRVWLGSSRAGVQLNLQNVEQSDSAAASSCGNDESGVLRCDDLIDAQYNVALGSVKWFNEGRGSASVQSRVGGTEALVSVRTGALTLRSGEVPLRLSWRLLLTPVRNADQRPRADFGTRPFHMSRAPPDGQLEGALQAANSPWVILHQGNQLNPYINYPFLTVRELRDFVRRAHAAGARVKIYYTVRELSGAAGELWALRAFGTEAVVRSRKAGGHPWLREHLRSNYSAAWHEMLNDGEVDASVHTPAFTGRWDNYWIEGILWLVRNLDLDGIYLDGAPYDHRVLRRLRRALRAAGKPDFHLDLHASCYGNPHLPYAELYAHLDSLWFGEQCHYHTYSPEEWLAEVAGVAYGLPAQILGDNREQWQGLVFGMLCRIYPDPQRCNPRPLYKALDELGVGGTPLMLGWWDDACPVSVRVQGGAGGTKDVRATVFIGPDGRAAVAVANWARAQQSAALTANVSALASLGWRGGRPGGSVAFVAREIDGFQGSGRFAAGATFEMNPFRDGFNEGWLFEIVGSA